MIASLYLIIFMNCGIPTGVEAQLDNIIVNMEVIDYRFHRDGSFDMFFQGSYDQKEFYDLVLKSMQEMGRKPEIREGTCLGA